MDVDEAESQEADDPELWAHWARTCRFFCHPETEMTTGARLEGFSRPLRPNAMMKIERELRRLAKPNQSEHDHLIPLDREETVALMGIVASCWKVFSACWEHNHSSCPGDHATGRVDASSLETLVGIQCCCREDSLTKAVVERSLKEPHVVVARDAFDAEAYARAVDRLFAPTGEGGVAWMKALRLREKMGSDLYSVMAWDDIDDESNVETTELTARFMVASKVNTIPPKPLTVAQLANLVRLQPTAVADFMEGEERTRIRRERLILILDGSTLDVQRFDQSLSGRTKVVLDDGRLTRVEVKLMRMVMPTTVVASGVQQSRDRVVDKRLVDFLRGLVYDAMHNGRETLLVSQLRETIY